MSLKMPAVIKGVKEWQERTFPSRRGGADGVVSPGNSHVRTVNPSFVRTPYPEMEMFWPMTCKGRYNPSISGTDSPVARP